MRSAVETPYVPRLRPAPLASGARKRGNRLERLVGRRLGRLDHASDGPVQRLPQRPVNPVEQVEPVVIEPDADQRGIVDLAPVEVPEGELQPGTAVEPA